MSWNLNLFNLFAITDQNNMRHSKKNLFKKKSLKRGFRKWVINWCRNVKIKNNRYENQLMSLTIDLRSTKQVWIASKRLFIIPSFRLCIIVLKIHNTVINSEKSNSLENLERLSSAKHKPWVRLKATNKFAGSTSRDCFKR